jgi:hypothetical protein
MVLQTMDELAMMARRAGGARRSTWRPQDNRAQRIARFMCDLPILVAMPIVQARLFHLESVH